MFEFTNRAAHVRVTTSKGLCGSTHASAVSGGHRVTKLD